MTTQLHSPVRFLSRFVVLATFCIAAPLFADTPINAVPFTISSPGRYFLAMNLNSNNSSKSAITIDADDVTIDFQDHSLTGGAGQGTNANGITATNHRNITIKNGTIHGFKTAIVLQRGFSSSTINNNANNVVQNMRLSWNTFGGILITDGTGCQIERCEINRTGGTYTGVDAFGISLQFSSVVARHNQISNVFATAGTSFGIVSNNSWAFLIDNQIETAVNGISVLGNSGQTKYRKNLTINVPRPFNGGTDLGDNN